MELRIKLLERRLYFAYLIILLIMLFQVGSFFRMPAEASGEIVNSADGIIKTRGVIIVDEQGRERILLGAPIPSAKNRVRTDLAKVKDIWGKNFSPKYMEWYKDYNHNINGMLVLDHNGFDRLAVGDQVPDPNIGKRTGPQTGLIFNDEQGYERGGFGLLKARASNKYRVVLGLDSAKGQEGATLSLFDDGPVGLDIRNNKDSTYIGFLPPKTFENDTASPFNGILLKRDKETRYQVNTLQENKN